MAIKVEFLKTTDQIARLATGWGARDPHWKVTIDKEGYRRLIRFLLAGGTRNYGKIPDPRDSLTKIAKDTGRVLAIRGGSRYAARKLIKKTNFQKTTVRINGWAPMANKEYSAALEKAREIKAEAKELKESVVEKAKELQNDPNYQSLKRNLHTFYEEHDGNTYEYSTLTQEQKNKLLRAASGRDTTTWNNLLASNVFDTSSRSLLRQFRGDHRLLLGMILMGCLDQAGTIANTHTPQE